MTELLQPGRIDPTHSTLPKSLHQAEHRLQVGPHRLLEVTALEQQDPDHQQAGEGHDTQDHELRVTAEYQSRQRVGHTPDGSLHRHRLARNRASGACADQRQGRLFDHLL